MRDLQLRRSQEPAAPLQSSTDRAVATRCTSSHQPPETTRDRVAVPATDVLFDDRLPASVIGTIWDDARRGRDAVERHDDAPAVRRRPVHQRHPAAVRRGDAASIPGTPTKGWPTSSCSLPVAVFSRNRPGAIGDGQLPCEGDGHTRPVHEEAEFPILRPRSGARRRP